MDVRHYSGLAPGALDRVIGLDDKFCKMVADGALSSGISPQ